MEVLKMTKTPQQIRNEVEKGCGKNNKILQRIEEVKKKIKSMDYDISLTNGSGRRYEILWMRKDLENRELKALEFSNDILEKALLTQAEDFEKMIDRFDIISILREYKCSNPKSLAEDIKEQLKKEIGK